MIGTVRGVFTVVGAGAAGLLIWVSTQIGEGTTGGYWAVYGLLAGAGLTMALSQLFGGWTKWGWPKVSIGVFLIGFLPALVAAGWVLLSGQPQGNWFQSHITAWSGHLAIGGLVSDLREYLGVLAFGLGLIFGFTFDTSGPTAPPFRRRVPERVEEPRPAVETLPEPEVQAPTPTTRPTQEREREREKQHVR